MISLNFSAFYRWVLYKVAPYIKKRVTEKAQPTTEINLGRIQQTVHALTVISSEIGSDTSRSRFDKRPKCSRYRFFRKLCANCPALYGRPPICESI